MNRANCQRLALSIAIVAMMLSATLLVQTSTATGENLIQKSITLTPGADGRAFAVINDTYSYWASQRVDFNNDFDLLAITRTNSYTVYSYTGIGPKFEDPQSGFDPYSFSTGPLSSHTEVPKFMMMRNTTNNVVSPTINLTANAVTLGFGSTTEFQVDTSNYVVAVLKVTSAEQNKLVALTGLVMGSTVDYTLYYPNGVYYTDSSLAEGYFTLPFLASTTGDYLFYLASAGFSSMQVTPKVLDVTSLSIGSYASGEIKLPAEIDLNNPATLEPAPSDIRAVSCDVPALSAVTVSNSMLERLSGSLTSQVTWWFFSTLKYENGIPVGGELTPSPMGSPVLWGPTSTKVYIVLVGDVPTRINYMMGFTPVVVPTAPMNVPFLVHLPLPAGAPVQEYMFNVTQDSMVRFNCSSVTGDPIDAVITKITPDGTIYYVSDTNIGVGNNLFILGAAERSNTLGNAIYMSAGIYGIVFASSGTSDAQVEINTYPIVDFASPVGVTGHTTKALAITITNPLQYYTFNVSLQEKSNRSILYQFALFDDYNRILGSVIRNGSTGYRGIGNKFTTSGWTQLPSALRYVDPSGTTAYFNGNSTNQQTSCMFVPSYTGRYYLVLDCLGAWDTTRAGTSVGTRWYNYTGSVPLSISLSNPIYTNVVTGLDEITYASLDSSSGSGSTSVTYTSAGSNDLLMVGLKLTPKVNTWTRITVTIINGTSGATSNITTTRDSTYYEKLVDKIRYGPVGSETNTFNPDNSPAFFPWRTYYTVFGTSDPQNATYIIEFGALQSETMVRFLIDVYSPPPGPGTAAHTVVSFSVSHYSTPVFSGLRAPPSQPVTGSLVAHIVDSSTGAAIANASVVSTSQPAGQAALDGLTNSTGHILFSDILPGAYNLNASMTGYNSNSVSVTVVTDVTTSTEISLSAIAGQPAPFPWEIVLIVVAVVAVALIVILVVVKKKSKKS